VGRFGVEMHPRFGTKVPSNGIDIAAPAGAPIVAVAAGTIEFVDWLPGYGRCVIVNHGGGFYTLYAHCSRTLVAKGAKVAAGQKVAEVGDTDSVKGTILHFEIRKGQDAMNPEEWLQ
jgi:murein DD-endopeptidase MepM/ murein hydrolase activator NlpD